MKVPKYENSENSRNWELGVISWGFLPLQTLPQFHLHAVPMPAPASICLHDLSLHPWLLSGSFQFFTFFSCGLQPMHGHYFKMCKAERNIKKWKKIIPSPTTPKATTFLNFLKYCINMCDVFTRIIPPWICTAVLSVVILGGGMMVLTFIFIPLYNVGKNMHIYWLKIKGKQ